MPAIKTTLATARDSSSSADGHFEPSVSTAESELTEGSDSERQRPPSPAISEATTNEFQDALRPMLSANYTEPRDEDALRRAGVSFETPEDKAVSDFGTETRGLSMPSGLGDESTQSDRNKSDGYPADATGEHAFSAAVEDRLQRLRGALDEVHARVSALDPHRQGTIDLEDVNRELRASGIEVNSVGTLYLLRARLAMSEDSTQGIVHENCTLRRRLGELTMLLRQSNACTAEVTERLALRTVSETETKDEVDALKRYNADLIRKLREVRKATAMQDARQVNGHRQAIIESRIEDISFVGDFSQPDHHQPTGGHPVNTRERDSVVDDDRQEEYGGMF